MSGTPGESQVPFDEEGYEKPKGPEPCTDGEGYEQGCPPRIEEPKKDDTAS